MKKQMLIAAALLAASTAAVRAEDAAVPTPAAAPVAEAAPAATAPQAEASLAEFTLGTGVENRAIVGAAESFPAGTPAVYCLTAVTTKNAPTTVKHVWSKDGAVISTVDLAVKGSPWRTWSYHTMSTGAWKVEVQDANGAVIDAKSFTLQ